MQYSGHIDPITFSIVLSKMYAIANDMRDTMLMSARSIILSEARDLSVGILDYQGEPLITPDLLPCQMCGINYSVYPIIDTYKGDIRPGDVFINNSSYHGGTHNPEILKLCPVFYEDELILWTYVRPHNTDIGAYLPATQIMMAENVYQEGLHITPYRIARDRKYDEPFLKILMQNVRLAHLFKSDFLASLGTIWKGEAKIRELLEKYGIKVIKDWIKEYQEYGSRLMSNVIQNLPEGTWYGEDSSDPFPGVSEEGLTARLKLSIDHNADEIILDLSKSDDQTNIALNVSYGATAAACIGAVLTCLDPKLPRNWGAWKHLKIVTRKGSLFNPIYPAATMCSTNQMASRLGNLIITLFAEIDPRVGHAACGVQSCHSYSGIDWRRNTPYGCLTFFGSPGGPATMGYDGWPNFLNLGCLGSILTGSVEVHEQNFPHLIRKLEVPADSGGFGKWIGGPGSVLVAQARESSVTVVPLGEGYIKPAKGVLGGGPGLTAFHGYADCETNELIEDWDYQGVYITPKDGVWIRAYQGGGGFGNPLERDPELVRQSAREGFISLESAHDIYGVCLNSQTENYDVDYTQTEKLRRILIKQNDEGRK